MLPSPTSPPSPSLSLSPPRLVAFLLRRAPSLTLEHACTQGFAFCEYVDPAVTEVACQGLNGMELGDRSLVVQRAQLGAAPGKAPGPPGSGIGFPDHQMGGGGGPGGIPSAPGAPPASIMAGMQGEAQPTRVLQILNMVSVDELTNDADYADIVDDIKDECGNFGKVEDVKIPRPVKTAAGKVDIKASEAVKDLGKVFVLFEKEDETTAALKAIAGRKFGGASFSLSLSLVLSADFADSGLSPLQVVSASAPTPLSSRSSTKLRHALPRPFSPSLLLLALTLSPCALSGTNPPSPSSSSPRTSLSPHLLGPSRHDAQKRARPVAM